MIDDHIAGLLATGAHRALRKTELLTAVVVIAEHFAYRRVRQLPCTNSVCRFGHEEDLVRVAVAGGYWKPMNVHCGTGGCSSYHRSAKSAT